MNAIDLARDYIRAWNQRDLDLFGKIFASGVTYLDPFVGPEPIRVQAMGEYVQQLLAAFPDLHFEVKEVRGGDDFAVFEWIMHGRNTGDSAVHPATGRALSLPGMDVLEVRDGRIQAIRAYFDRQAYTDSLDLASAGVDDALAITA